MTEDALVAIDVFVTVGDPVADDEFVTKDDLVTINDPSILIHQR